MPLSASLQFGNNATGRYTREYLVVKCRCRFSRHHNAYHPDTDALCDSVELTVVAPGKEDLNLYEWYIDQTALSGRILFDLSSQSTDGSISGRELHFEDAQCFSLSEDYHIDNTSRRLLKLEFMADRIVINKVLFTHA